MSAPNDTFALSPLFHPISPIEPIAPFELRLPSHEEDKSESGEDQLDNDDLSENEWQNDGEEEEEMAPYLTSSDFELADHMDENFSGGYIANNPEQALLYYQGDMIIMPSHVSCKNAIKINVL